MAIKRKLEGEASCSDLGVDALECILRKLPCQDVFRFKKVCRLWYSVAEGYISSPYYSLCFQTPWLLLPSHQEDDDDDEEERSLCFLNLDERKEYREVSVCGEVHKGRCVGSSNGWLVLLHKNAYLSVFNPFTDVQIPVGSLKEDLNMDDIEAHTIDEDPRAFVPKAIVMYDNYEEEEDINGVVVIVYGSKRELAYCSYRDGKFEKLDAGHHQPYHDIICYDTNKVYALSESGSVVYWNFSGSSPQLIRNMTPSFPTKTAEFIRSFRDLYSCHCYLAESCGELLFIVRLIGELVDRDGKPVREADLLSEDDTEPRICPYKTLLFHVYRLECHDKDKKEVWVEMESLGDRVVFIGGNHSISLKAEDCRGCVKDSIYFTDSYWERVDEDYSYGGHDMGYYSLKDRSVKPFYDTQLRKMKPIPFWVVPYPMN